jgi:uncharacterized protein YuzE
MRLISTSRDFEADALYLQLARGKVHRTIELDEGTLVDVDAAGSPLGIEVLNPARAWPLQDFVDRFAVDDELRAVLEQIAGTPVQSPQEPAHTASATKLFALG